MNDSKLTIEVIKDFKDIKNYVTPQLIDLISDDNASNTLVFTFPICWVKVLVKDKICGLVMIRPVNTITAEIHPLIQSKHAVYAKRIIELVTTWLEKQGKIKVLGFIPSASTQALKLASICGWECKGCITNAWVKKGIFSDILIYQKG